MSSEVDPIFIRETRVGPKIVPSSKVFDKGDGFYYILDEFSGEWEKVKPFLPSIAPEGARCSITIKNGDGEIISSTYIRRRGMWDPEEC